MAPSRQAQSTKHGQSTAKPTAKCSSNEDEAAHEARNNTNAANTGTQLIDLSQEEYWTTAGLGFKASGGRIKATLNLGAHMYAGHKFAGHYMYAGHTFAGHDMHAGHQDQPWSW